MRGFIGVLFTLFIVLVAGTIGYNMGLGANVAAADPGTTVVYPGWGFGFPFFGLIFGILFFVLIFGLISRAAWGGHRGYGRGGWARHGGWDGKSVPPVADQMLERWHRQAHGEPGSTDKHASSTPPGDFGSDR